MNTIKSTLVVGTLAALAAGSCTKERQPNVVIIFTDDQGYQDLGCFGSPLISTPRIDQMAAEGLRLTDFHVSTSVSSASRAALLTGRLNTKNGVPNVYFPDADGGLPTEEITIAEMLREQGYATMCIGKWHVGDKEELMPLNQGFDQYFGIPYSNDMYIASHQKFASDVVFREGYTMEQALEDQALAAKKNIGVMRRKLGGVVPLMSNSEIVEYPCDQTTVTRRYIDKAIEFISGCGDKPFFAYITPSMPHTPLYASEQFKGTSKRGLYGDVVEELDWNIGRLLDYLDESGLSENTLVIFASDNGPYLAAKEDGGSADPLRDGKFSVYDGGVKVPCVMMWKGKIPAGTVSDDLVASIDLFPTIVGLSGTTEITHEIDGVDQLSLLMDPTSGSNRDEYLYYRNGEVRGIRQGSWVYLIKAGEKGKDPETAELYHIHDDISQKSNLRATYPERAAAMRTAMESYIIEE